MKRNTLTSIKKVGALTIISTLAVAGLTACGGADSSKASEAGEGVKTIIIGSGNAYNPYCYLDEEGKAVGYE